MSSPNPVPARHPQLLQILRDRSLRQGRFVLASGKISSYYIDGKMTSFDPAGSAAIVDAIFKELAHIPFDAIGGMDMGGTPIVGAVANRSFYVGKPIPTFVVRKDVKAHGTMKRIEGPIPPPPCNVVVIEDVVTTGDSLFKAIDAVIEYGAKVALAITVLDRAAGAAQALAARSIPYQPLCTLAELGLEPI
jgi:orotate phosphoribosyltransferase